MTTLTDAANTYAAFDADPYTQDSSVAMSLTPGRKQGMSSFMRSAIFGAPGLGAAIQVLFDTPTIGSSLAYGAVAAVALTAALPSDYVTRVAVSDVSLGFGLGYWGADALGLSNGDLQRQVLIGMAAAFVLGSGALNKLGVASNTRLSTRYAKVVPTYDDTELVRGRRY